MRVCCCVCCAGTDAEQSGEVLRLCDKDNDNSVSYQHTVYMRFFSLPICVVLCVHFIFLPERVCRGGLE